MTGTVAELPPPPPMLGIQHNMMGALWARTHIGSYQCFKVVIHLAQTSMPPLETVFAVSASMMLRPNLNHEAVSLTAAVPTSLAIRKATVSDIEDKLEVDPQCNQLM